MELYEAIAKRRSVRKYQGQASEDDKLRRVLDAGRQAPSANNLQDWKFVVVQDQVTLAKLAQAAEQPWLAEVPAIIAAVGTNGRAMLCDVPAAPVDCAIALDHMTLAAAAEGLGTCWIGHFHQDDCKEILDVPAEAKIIEMLTIGYPAGLSKTDKPRKSFDEVVCFEKFRE